MLKRVILSLALLNAWGFAICPMAASACATEMAPPCHSGSEPESGSGSCCAGAHLSEAISSTSLDAPKAHFTPILYASTHDQPLPWPAATWAGVIHSLDQLYASPPFYAEHAGRSPPSLIVKSS